MTIRVEVVRRDIDTPDGRETVTFYEVHVVAPNGARSVQRDRTYKTEAEAEAAAEQMRKT